MKKFTNLGMALLIVLFGTTGLNAQTGEACGCPAVSARPVVNISTLANVDVNGNLTSDATLTCDNIWRLDQSLYVGPGRTLNIKPGTVIKGATASVALIVTRDGRVEAKGTKDCQIIFTGDNDNVDGTYGVENAAQWGGVIMLGRASNNIDLAYDDAADPLDPGLRVARGLGTIEGLAFPDPRHQYGANLDGTDIDGVPQASETFDDEDDSGTLRYVSIRHGGFVFGTDNEINGLTLGSVGRGTCIEHVEVVANGDDGIEFFGGTVDVRYISILFCKDDYFDWDHGWTGRAQFVFGVQHPDNNTNGDKMGDNGLEMDNDDQNADSTPYSDPQIWNVTMLGNTGDVALEAKERTLGTVANSIFTEYGTGVNITEPNSTDDFESLSNTFIDVTTNQSGYATYAADNNIDATAADNVIDFDWTMDASTNAVTNSLNAVPLVGTAQASTSIAPPADDFFWPANYRGAFEPGQDPWVSCGYLSTLGLDAASADCPTDLDNNGVTDVADFLNVLGQFGVNCASN